MSDFSTEATVEFRVDKSSLRDVRRTVEDELGATEVGATDGGAASAQSGRLSGRRRRRARRTFRLDRERNERLGEVVALLDDIEENIAAGGDSGSGLLSGLGQGVGRGLTGLGLGAGAGLAGIGIGAGVGLATGDLPEGIGRGLGEAVGLSAEGIGEGLGNVLGGGGDFFEGIGEGLGGVLHGPGDEQTTVENVSVQQAQFSLDTATIQMDQGAIGTVVTRGNGGGGGDTTPSPPDDGLRPIEEILGEQGDFNEDDAFITDQMPVLGIPAEFTGRTFNAVGRALGTTDKHIGGPISPIFEDDDLNVGRSVNTSEASEALMEFGAIGRLAPTDNRPTGPPPTGEPTLFIDPMNRPNLGPGEIRGSQPTGGGATTGTNITQIDTLRATGVSGSIEVAVETTFDRLRDTIERELGSEIDRVERELEGEIEQLRRDITGK